MLIFQNPGLIDETAITTIAVNAKLGNSPIGVFGTGLKYAISIILRLGGRVTIYRGLKKLEFGIKRKEVRGKEFNIVTMNGRQLGFTTHLGHHWQAWQAYRELWSNAKDEQGTVRMIDSADIERKEQLQPARKQTLVVVECKELDEVHMLRHEIVLSTEPLQSLQGVDVHPGESKFIYYRGIRVYEFPQAKKSIYTYNLTATQMLTEDRTLLYPHIAPVALARAVISSTWRPFLAQVLSSDTVKDRWENGLAYSSVSSDTPSTEFMEIAEQLRDKKDLVHAAMKLFKDYQDTMPGYVSPYIVELTGVEQAIADEAVSLIMEAVPQLPTPYKIQFKSSMQTGVVSVGKETITLDHKIIQMGSRKVARYMLEGFAALQGGGVVEQLAALILDGRFIDKELTEELAPASLGFDDGIPF